MIDPMLEEVFPYSESQKRLGFSRDTLESYINRGRPVKNPKTGQLTGEMAYMDRCAMPAGCWGTSREAYLRFISALNGIVPNGD